jgi:hypothetical protein
MMRIALAWIVGIGLAINGLAMLGLPETWYGSVPGVAHTGPFNPHFVRDIGCAYLMAGGALVWFALRPAVRPAAWAGAIFLGLHALVHFWDFAAGREELHHLLVDLPTAFSRARAGDLDRLARARSSQGDGSCLDG